MDEEDFALITSDEGMTFLNEFRHADPSKLILNPPKKDFPEVSRHIRLFVDQLISRKKAIKKLPSWSETPGLVYPPPLSLEQSSSEETANYKKHLIKGTVLVDLTGGMGIDFLALSENFEESHYVERNHELCEVFDHNARRLGKDKVYVHNEEASVFLTQWASKASTCFFFDPARRGENNSKVFKLTDCEPDATELLPGILQKGATALIKTSPMLDIDLALSELSHVKEVHLVASRNELKEVLYLIVPGHEGEPKIVAINLTENPKRFTFSKSEETEAQSQLGPVEKWVYEPNVAILKAGAYKLIGDRYGLKKLGTNSHLYSSENLVKEFPGRTFEVLAEVTKSNLKRLLPDQKTNILTRNHPLSPDQLKKKYKLKDGGEFFLIGTRVINSPILLLCKLVGH